MEVNKALEKLINDKRIKFIPISFIVQIVIILDDIGLLNVKEI